MSDGRPLRVRHRLIDHLLGIPERFQSQVVQFIPSHPGFNSFVHATSLSRIASGPWSAAVKRLLLASPSQCTDVQVAAWSPKWAVEKSSQGPSIWKTQHATWNCCSQAWVQPVLVILAASHPFRNGKYPLVDVGDVCVCVCVCLYAYGE